MISKNLPLLTHAVSLISSCIVSIGLFGAAEPTDRGRYDVKRALLVNNIPLVKSLITQHPEYAKDGIDFGYSHLHIAINLHLDLPFIQWLVSMGTPVVSPATVKKTTFKIHLLQTAVIADYAECIPLLLAHGIDIDDRDNEGRTPLMIAALCNRNRVSCLRMLLAHGSAINAQDDKGMTALHWALMPQKGVKDVYAAQAAFILLMHNADTTLTNDKGRKALDEPLSEANDVAKQEYVKTEGKMQLYELAHSQEVSRLCSIANRVVTPVVDQCPICLETKNLTFWGLCGHQLCAGCKTSWMRPDRSNGALCPLCRQPGIED